MSGLSGPVPGASPRPPYHQPGPSQILQRNEEISPKETPNKVDGGGGSETQANLLTAAWLEAVHIGENRGCSEVFLCCFRDQDRIRV
jgi:hypothetical protein